MPPAYMRLHGFSGPCSTIRLLWRARWHLRQRQHQIEIVVGSNTIEPLEAASQALVDNNMLAISPLKHPDGTHQRTAGTRTVPRLLGIHMPRVETVWAVIAVVSTAWQRTHKLVAVAAAEALLGRMPMAPLRMLCGHFFGPQTKVASLAALALAMSYWCFIRALVSAPVW